MRPVGADARFLPLSSVMMPSPVMMRDVTDSAHRVRLNPIAVHP